MRNIAEYSCHIHLYSKIVVCTLILCMVQCVYIDKCVHVPYILLMQAEQYAVTVTPTLHRKALDGEVTTDEDITEREEKGLLGEHLQIAIAQTKFT